MLCLDRLMIYLIMSKKYQLELWQLPQYKNWRIDKMKRISMFLDANIYIRYNFNIHITKHMNRLKDFIKGDINVKLFTNKIVEKEYLSAINRKAKETFEDFSVINILIDTEVIFENYFNSIIRLK